MIEVLLGSQSCEQVLLYIVARERGYAREISQYFNVSETPIKRQLLNLEAGGILIAEEMGRTRLFQLNPRCPFASEIRALFEKVISFMTETDREKLSMNRNRPRRTGKPL